MSRVEQFLLGGHHNRAAVHIGLVNNMPDAAMRATELQFARLLKDAAGALDVRLRLFNLRGIERSEQTRARMDGFYDDAGFLQAAHVDALIVTGAQPASDDLRDESYWPELAQLIDWAEIGTVSTMFSCLSAHAAVLHLDGVRRQPMPRKLSGLYQSARVEDDPLFFGLPLSGQVPHSRRNTVVEEDLTAKGYRILSRLGNGQADIFTREPAGHSRFVFFQGHPEYDAGTLGREYLRDMGRFLRGEQEAAPAIPEHYFDRATENRLAEIRPTGESSLAEVAGIMGAALPLSQWRGNTVRLFANWLTLVAATKSRKLASRAVHTRRRAS
jgi:homoserine O-succinyltransferase/O-acetyltransferase